MIILCSRTSSFNIKQHIYVICSWFDDNEGTCRSRLQPGFRLVDFPSTAGLPDSDRSNPVVAPTTPTLTSRISAAEIPVTPLGLTHSWLAWLVGIRGGRAQHSTWAGWAGAFEQWTANKSPLPRRQADKPWRQALCSPCPCGGGLAATACVGHDACTTGAGSPTPAAGEPWAGKQCAANELC